MANVLYVPCPPAGARLRFLSNLNAEIDPAAEALNVSNHVSDDAALPANAAFGDTCADPDNFRLELEHPTFTGASVTVELKVANRAHTSYTLNKKAAAGGRVFRGDFLRLVTDDPDNAVVGNQTILCKLGEKVHFFFTDSGGCTDVKIIGVGRPPTDGEGNNGTNQRLHDIREVKVYVHVFGATGQTNLAAALPPAATPVIQVVSVVDAQPSGMLRIGNEGITYTGIDAGANTFTGCARGAVGAVAAHANGAPVRFTLVVPVQTRSVVEQHLDVVDQRFAQATVRVKRPVTIDIGGEGDLGKQLPFELLDGYSEGESDPDPPHAQLTLTDDELALIALKAGDANTINVFYYDEPFGPNVGGVAYITSLNGTGNAAAKNFIVMFMGGGGITLAHEFMHLLGNAGHRDNEPATALLHRESGKRIGPYPDAQTSGVGVNDTTVVRDNAESLP